jgi:hypothetical protein
MDYGLVLSKKFQGQSFSIGDTYESIVSLDGSPIPTEAKLKVLWPEVQYEVAYEQVEQARQQAYRETSDPLFFQYQRGTATEQEWLDAVQAVKDAHPYPEDVTTNETE